MKKKELISLIVPCYNEEQAIPYYCKEIKKQILVLTEKFSNVDYEVIFVDDGSDDGTLECIKRMEMQNVQYISFSRNFGKEAALYAGFIKSKGDFVVTMDVDLQDPPELLEQMLCAVLKEGYDSAATRRVNRIGEPPIRSFFARMFYKLINQISNVEVVDGARDYRIMNRKMVDAILSIPERNRFTKGIYGWIGFKTKWIEFENVERRAGETKWSFSKLFTYALDGIIAYSTAPLSMATVTGIILAIISVAAILFVVVRKLIFGDPTSGWASMICVILMLGSMQLFAIGIIGQYLAKTYIETKQRPIFIVNEESEE